MVRAFGLNPEEILTKEALSMSNGTVIMAGKATSEDQMDTLLYALKQNPKKIYSKNLSQHAKQYNSQCGNGSPGEIRTLVSGSRGRHV
jgi:hypothetical protein